MNLDMHFHSKKSDGNKTIEELVIEIKNTGLNIAFCTDHDVISDEFITLARQNKITTTHSVEISSGYNNKSHHLTYYDKKFNSGLNQYLNKLLEYRSIAIKKIIELMIQNGFDITVDDFYNYCQNKNYSIGNLNIFNLVNYIYDGNNYFKYKLRIIKLFGKEVSKIFFLKNCLKREGEYNHIGFPKDFSMYYPSLNEISTTLNNNYILSVAHPNFTFKTIEKFISYVDYAVGFGLNAVEINTFTNQERLNEIFRITKKYDLFLTFGSDTHFLGRDEKHGDLGELNSLLDKSFIEKEFDKYSSLILD